MIDLIELNEEITVLEETFIDEKLEYELRKARLFTESNWSEILGKAKPTQKDIENNIKIQTIDDERSVKQLENVVKSKKRLLEILMIQEAKD